MLVQQGSARSSEADRRLACSLAGVAGALNTAAFYAVGLYSANMSGNVSALADHLGVAQLWEASIYLALVAVFVAGATTSTLLINAGRRRGLAEIYAFSILAEALLLIVLGVVDLCVPGLQKGPGLALGLSFLMGLQNAAVTRISNARVRTTHVTGMVTDIGIELGNLLDLRGREGAQEEIALNKDNLRLHAQTVLSFLAGGVVGVVTFRAFGTLLLFAAALILLAMAIQGIVAGRDGTSRVPQRG